MNAYSIPESLVEPVKKLEEYRKRMLVPFRILTNLGWLLFFLGPATGIGLMLYYLVFLHSHDLNFTITVTLIPFVLGLFGGGALLVIRTHFSNKIRSLTRKTIFESYVNLSYQDIVFPPKGQALLFNDFQTLSPYGPIDYFEELNSYSASYRGVGLRACDTLINYFVPGGTFSVDHLGGSSSVMDIGRMVAIDLGRDLGASLFVTDSKKKPPFSAAKTETEYIDFNRVFDVYSDSKLFVFYVLTPQFQEKLLNLSKKYPDRFKVSFYVMGPKAYVVMENVCYGSDAVWTDRPLTEEYVLKATLLLDLAKDFIDGLKLYSEKYQEVSLGRAV